MASVEECREALTTLSRRLTEMSPQDRASYFSNRSMSCHVTDLGVTFVTRFTDSGTEPVTEAKPDDPPADIRLTASSDDVISLSATPSNAQPDPDLWEWDYGGYEGLTTPQIQETRPGWYLWRDGVIPGDAAHPGETIVQVAHRVGRLLARVVPLLADGDVALVAHGHVLRVLTACYLRLPPA